MEREQLVVGVGASSTTLFLLWMELLGVSRTDPEQVYRVERQGVTQETPCALSHHLSGPTREQA